MKHINKLFLLLAALMLLGGCGQATAPADSPPAEAPPQVEAAPEPPAAPDPAPDLEADAPAEDLTADNAAAETPSDAAPEAALLEVPVPPDVQRIPVGEAFAADLDGDGSFETVQLTMDAAESGSAAGTLTVWYDGGRVLGHLCLRRPRRKLRPLRPRHHGRLSGAGAAGSGTFHRPGHRGLPVCGRRTAEPRLCRRHL